MIYLLKVIKQKIKMTDKINKKIEINLVDLLKSNIPFIFEDGKINIEKLKQSLEGKLIENGDDRFYFNWSGKNRVFQAIQAPAYSTLAPLKEKSINWDKTENIVIVGENLETLKLLLKPYFGQVKVIYIDPPYNTGKDFVYKDDFSSPLKTYLEKTGQIDAEGNKLTTNTETSGRYHSDWLNFMYPRLFLARNLLSDDGVIFISIDDHEVHHLRMIMDEIFGEENVEIMIWYKIPEDGTAGQGKMKITYRFRFDHEYIIVGYKNKDKTIFNKPLILKSFKQKYSNPDNDPRGEWISCEICKSEEKSNPKGKNYYTVITPKGIKITRQWHISKEEFEKLNNEKRIYWGDGTIIPRLKKFINEPQLITPSSIIKNISQTQGNKDIKKLFDGNLLFENPKPTELISWLLKLSTNKDSVIFDFFAGSGTTGQAVWELNKEDGGKRKFILVQLDEPVDEIKETGKNAKKLGLNTIADICIERLKRVSEKMKKSDDEKLIKENENLDLGFKVFKLAPSNFNLKEEFELEENKNLEELKKQYLEKLSVFVDQPLVYGKTSKINVVYEILIKNGFSLTSKIEEIKIADNIFYYAKDEKNNLEIFINLEEKITDKTVEEIRTNKYKEKTFVFFDNALTDSQKINLNTFVKLKVI